MRHRQRQQSQCHSPQQVYGSGSYEDLAYTGALPVLLSVESSQSGFPGFRMGWAGTGRGTRTTVLKSTAGSCGYTSDLKY